MNTVAVIAELLELTNDAHKDTQKPLEQLEQTSPLAQTIKSLEVGVSNHHDMLHEVSNAIVGKDLEREVVPENLLIDGRETLISLIRLLKKDYSYATKIWVAPIYRGRQRQIKSLMRNLRLFNWNFELILNKSKRVSTPLDETKVFRDSPNAQYMRTYDSEPEDSKEQAIREEILSWISPHDFDTKHRREREFQRNHTHEWLIQSVMFSTWRRSGHGVFILINYRTCEARKLQCAD